MQGGRGLGRGTGAVMGGVDPGQGRYPGGLVGQGGHPPRPSKPDRTISGEIRKHVFVTTTITQDPVRTEDDEIP